MADGEVFCPFSCRYQLRIGIALQDRVLLITSHDIGSGPFPFLSPDQGYPYQRFQAAMTFQERLGENPEFLTVHPA